MRRSKVGVYALWLSGAVVVVGCANAEDPPEDASVEVDAGPQNFRCDAVASACGSIDAADCASTTGCALSGTCGGTPFSCFSFNNLASCESQNGCRWDNVFCDSTPVRSCAAMSFAQCENNGCSLASAWCVDAPGVCARQAFDDCEATPVCSVVCDPGLVACARGCVPEAEATDDLSCVRDCSGALGGTASRDECGVCDDDPTNDCENDCLGVPHGTATIDRCGTCDDDPTNDCTWDCNFVWGGSVRDDRCGTCDDDPTNDCVQDCNGVWGGFGVEEGGICSSSSPAWCTGEWLFGRCWFLGAAGQSCNSACSARGRSYDPATEQVTGSRGMTADCTQVLNALGIDGTASRREGTGMRAQIGCAADPVSLDPVTYWLALNTGNLTTGDASYQNQRRACACE